MKRTTQREIKQMVAYGRAIDITNIHEPIRGLEIVAVSVGVYGRNGLLLKDGQGQLYAITTRATSIFAY